MIQFMWVGIPVYFPNHRYVKIPNSLFKHVLGNCGMAKLYHKGILDGYFPTQYSHDHYFDPDCL